MTERTEEKGYIGNPPMPEWATEDNGFTVGPSPHLTHPCGCHIRRPDYEAILCNEHLAELNGGDDRG